MVLLNVGEVLPFESELLSADLEIIDKMNRFSTHLGINTIVTRDMLRVYATPYKSRLDWIGFKGIWVRRSLFVVGMLFAMMLALGSIVAIFVNI